jgi:hypothetical protein
LKRQAVVILVITGFDILVLHAYTTTAVEELLHMPSPNQDGAELPYIDHH